MIPTRRAPAAAAGAVLYHHPHHGGALYHQAATKGGALGATRFLLHDFEMGPEESNILGDEPQRVVANRGSAPPNTLLMEGVRASIMDGQWSGYQLLRTRRTRPEGRRTGSAVMTREQEFQREQRFKNRKTVVPTTSATREDTDELNKLLGPFAKFIKRKSDMRQRQDAPPRPASSRLTSIVTEDGEVEQDEPMAPRIKKITKEAEVAPKRPKRLFSEKSDDRVWREEVRDKHHKHAYTVHNELSDDISRSWDEQKAAKSLRAHTVDADGAHEGFYKDAMVGQYDFDAEREKARAIVDGRRRGGPSSASSPLSNAWGATDPITASVDASVRANARSSSRHDIAASTAEESNSVGRGAAAAMMPSFAENGDGEALADDDLDGRGRTVFHSAVAVSQQRGLAAAPSASDVHVVPFGQVAGGDSKDITFRMVDPAAFPNPLTLAEKYVKELEDSRAALSDLQRSTTGREAAEVTSGEGDMALTYHPDDTFIPVRSSHTPLSPAAVHDSLAEHESHVPQSDLVTPEEVSRIATESTGAYMTTLAAELAQRDTRASDGDAITSEERFLAKSQDSVRILPQSAVFASDLAQFEKEHFDEKRRQRVFPVLPSALKPAPPPTDIVPSSGTSRQLDVSAFLGPRSEASIFDGVLCGKDNFEEEIVGTNRDGTDRIVRRKALRPGASRVGAFKYPQGVLDDLFVFPPTTNHGGVASVPINSIDDNDMLLSRDNGELQAQLEAQWSAPEDNPHFPSEGAETRKVGDGEEVDDGVGEWRRLHGEDFMLPAGFTFPKAPETMPRFRTKADKHRYMLVNLVAPEHTTARHGLKIEREILKESRLRVHGELASGGAANRARHIEGSQGHVPQRLTDDRSPASGELPIYSGHTPPNRLASAEAIDADELLPHGEKMHGKIGTSYSPLSEEARETILARRGMDEWGTPEGRALRNDIEEYRESNLERIEEAQVLGDAVVETAKAGLTTSIVADTERKYDVQFPRNLTIPNEWVIISRIVPTDGTAMTVIPHDEQVTIRVGDARRIARSLGLDLIKFSEIKSTHTNPVAICKLSDHRYDKRDFVAFTVKKRGITSPPVRECKEMSFRGTTHPHAVWFKSVTVGKLLSHGFPVQLRMTNFGGPREGAAAFQSVLMEVRRQAEKLKAYHTSGEVTVEYDLISCTLYPASAKSPKAAVVHPTTAELKAARDHRILEQDKEMYHEDLNAAFASPDQRDGVRYLRKLQLGTAWAEKDEGLTLKRSRDIKKIYGWIPKSNTKLYEARGDVELNAPFNFSTVTSVEKIGYPRETNLEQATRGIAVLQDRYTMAISDMHDRGQTEVNEATLSRGYYRMGGNALDIGALKESLGLKNNRRKLPRRTSGWSTLGVADDTPN